MSQHKPTPQDWHHDLPGECSCEPAWSERGLVDDHCEWHRLMEAVEWLREEGWVVKPPVVRIVTRVPWGPDHPSYDEMGQ